MHGRHNLYFCAPLLISVAKSFPLTVNIFMEPNKTATVTTRKQHLSQKELKLLMLRVLGRCGDSR